MEELVCRYCGKVLQSIEEGGVQGLRLFTSPFQSCSPDSLCETLRSKAQKSVYIGGKWLHLQCSSKPIAVGGKGAFYGLYVSVYGFVRMRREMSEMLFECFVKNEWMDRKS